MGLYAAGLAISKNEDRILVSGVHERMRGLFELTLPDGTLRMILQTDRDPKSGWGHVSLSPDGERVVARHNSRLELIDIVHVHSRAS
jgi:hypothetical protein